mmetsp:Transcript_3672/g.9941  ORF Transcript_3672/g.9941 Transcript_3672/m.9941 type:complete len:392 (+) Transcript_3672:1600-2775(+)
MQGLYLKETWCVCCSRRRAFMLLAVGEGFSAHTQHAWKWTFLLHLWMGRKKPLERKGQHRGVAHRQAAGEAGSRNHLPEPEGRVQDAISRVLAALCCFGRCFMTCVGAALACRGLVCAPSALGLVAAHCVGVLGPMRQMLDGHPIHCLQLNTDIGCQATYTEVLHLAVVADHDQPLPVFSHCTGLEGDIEPHLIARVEVKIQGPHLKRSCLCHVLGGMGKVQGPMGLWNYFETGMTSFICEMELLDLPVANHHLSTIQLLLKCQHGGLPASLQLHREPVCCRVHDHDVIVVGQRIRCEAQRDLGGHARRNAAIVHGEAWHGHVEVLTSGGQQAQVPDHGRHIAHLDNTVVHTSHLIVCEQHLFRLDHEHLLRPAGHVKLDRRLGLRGSHTI